MLRVAFLGSAGAYSATHLTALIAAHRVVGVFCGLHSRGLRGVASRLLRSTGMRSDPCTRIAIEHDIPVWFDNHATGLQSTVSSLAPDVICVAGYPWLLPSSVWQSAPLGALNSHPSLLPRHRGVSPLFWIYFHDDKTTGVTVHRLDERVDAGGIIAQDAFPLARGLSVDALNVVNAERGSRLLLQAVAAVSDGASGTPQDEARATPARRVPPGATMLDPTWDVERVWHFLTGLFPRFVEPLRDADGRAVDYGGHSTYERSSHHLPIGTVRRDASGWRLYCTGGIVSLVPRDSREVARRA